MLAGGSRTSLSLEAFSVLWPLGLQVVAAPFGEGVRVETSSDGPGHSPESSR